MNFVMTHWTAIIVMLMLVVMLVSLYCYLQADNAHAKCEEENVRLRKQIDELTQELNSR